MTKLATINIENETPIAELGQYANVQAIQDLIAEASGKQPAKHLTKEVLLEQVKLLVESSNLSEERVNTVIREYKFAGSVSVCWGMPLEYTGFTRNQIENLLRKNREINPFEAELRPELTQKPAFNRAEWLTENKLRVEFTYAGKAYELEDNYELRKIVPTKRISAYLRLLDELFVVETHGNVRETKQVHNVISLILGVEIATMTFSDRDILFLKKELKANTKASKFKRLGGDLDTIYVSASPELDDLEDSEEFKQKFSDGELRETRLEFVYQKASGHKSNVSIHISHVGNIWFMSDVSEDVIEYVFSVVRKIKFLPPLNRLQRISKSESESDEQIDALLKSIRSNGYSNRFSERIYILLGLQVDNKLWLETLSKLVQSGYLSQNFELCCPNCHESISVYHSYRTIPLDKEIDCNHCGHNFIVSAHDIFITYSFKDVPIAQSRNLITREEFTSPLEASLSK